METVKFTELDIKPEILKAVANMGFEAMSPIQAKAIPVELSGKDVNGQEQPGTGKKKTFCFFFFLFFVLFCFVCVCFGFFFFFFCFCFFFSFISFFFSCFCFFLLLFVWWLFLCLLQLFVFFMFIGVLFVFIVLSFLVEQGSVVGLIGPNGAGKTTVFNCITGNYKPEHGRITFGGQDITGKRPHNIVEMGIARTFQSIRLFKELSVIDNIKVGLHESMKYDLASSLIRLPNYWKEEKHCTERAFELLDIFHMADLADVPAGSLPYGAQRRLEIMRDLATSPKLLLLDEPAAGMNPSETAELTETIRRIRDEFNIAVLLIEHDMNFVMGICEGIAVLNFGRIIAKGTPDEIRDNPQVIEAYLGSDDSETW